MENIRFYINFTGEIENTLYQNNISLENIFKNSDFEYSISSDKTPFYDETYKTRDIVPVIIASSAAVGAITLAITHFLNTLFDKPYFVEYYQNVEIKDNEGKILLDKDGKPIFKQVKITELIQTHKKNRKMNLEFSFSIKNGIVIKIGSENQEK